MLGQEATSHLKTRWRRLDSSAPLLPGPYAKRLACRPELQVCGDWMLVPAARTACYAQHLCSASRKSTQERAWQTT
eukprot:8267741-Karenia_brevis.AAC.1